MSNRRAQLRREARAHSRGTREGSGDGFHGMGVPSDAEMATIQQTIEDDEIWAMTDPGCDQESHPFEVMGATWAYAQGNRWEQPAVMDCGCLLTVHSGFQSDENE